MATIEDVLVAIQNCDKKAEDRHTAILREINRIDKRIDDLECKVVNLDKERNECSLEIKSIKNELKNQVWQSNINHELLVKSVPEKPNETEDDLCIIVEQVLDLLEVKFDSFTTARRVGKHRDDRPRPIVVSVKDMFLKQIILKNKRLTPITLDKIKLLGKPIGDKTQYLYIDENITPMNGRLFKRARELKKQNIVKFAWTRNGTVFVRQGEKTKVIAVSNDYDLKNINTGTSNKRKNSDELNENPRKIVTRNKAKNGN